MMFYVLMLIGYSKSKEIIDIFLSSIFFNKPGISK